MAGSLAVLERTQANVSQARRRLDQKYWRVARPGWCKADDELRRFFDDQDVLILKGRVVWGVVVQANQLLFEPLDRDHRGAPATVIYTEEGDESTLPFLRELALRLFRLRNSQGGLDEDQAEYGAMLNEEIDRAMGCQVPPSMTDGMEVRSTTVFFPRKHLESQQLALTYFPLLVHSSTPAAMLVPSRYWPPGLKQRWQAEAVEAEEHSLSAADVSAVGVVDRLVLGMGWLFSVKGVCLSLLTAVLFFVSWGELKYQGQSGPVEIDTENLPSVEDGTYVTGELRLDYTQAVRATKGRLAKKSFLLIPVAGNESDFIVSFEDVAETGSAEIREERVSGRASRGGTVGLWDVGSTTLDLNRVFRLNKRTLGDDALLIAHGVKPEGKARFTFIMLICLVFWGHVTWRLCRGIRFIVDPSFLASFLDRHHGKRA